MLVLVLLQACDPWPRDPEGTLEQAAGGVLRVGATEAPPTLMRTPTGAAGPEAELIETLARSIDARIEWHWGAMDSHMKSLEEYQLDLVVGGITAGSPWKTRVGLSRPWRVDGETRYVVAVPPGENRMLVALERLIEARSRRGS